jgi:hypothetical protein
MSSGSALGCMGVVQIKPVQGLFWVMEQTPLITAPMAGETLNVPVHSNASIAFHS